jgi:thiol-disulfide isomerase/thioredoxin
MKTRTLGIVIVVVVAALAAALVARSMSSSAASGGAAGASGGQPSAARTGGTIAPADFKVADYAGKPLVVNLFGSWCPPCNAEAADLGAFAKDNPHVQVVGVACEDTEADAVDFMDKYGLTYPLVVDDGTLAARFGIGAFPTTIFFDAQGNEAGRLVGSQTLDQFNAALAKAQ